MKRIAYWLKAAMFEKDLSLWSMLYIFFAAALANVMDQAGYGFIAQSITAVSIIVLGACVEKVVA